MKCVQVRELLVAYLDHEVGRSEGVLIRAHLAECSACSEEMDGLARVQSELTSTLRAAATQAGSLSLRWDEFQARSMPTALRFPAWLNRLRSAAGRIKSPREGATSPGRRVALTLCVGLLIAMGTVALVPQVRGQLTRVIREMILGEFTTVWLVAPEVESGMDQAGAQTPLRPEDLWVIETEIGRFGGNVPPGMDASVGSVGRFEDAQTLTEFELLAPRRLPIGYSLRRIHLAPIDSPQSAVLVYGGRGHDTIIGQFRVGRFLTGEPGTSARTLGRTGVGIGTDGVLEDVDLDGRPAAWVDGHTLVWEADSMCYIVGGLDLSLAEALEIARSLR